MKSRVKFNATVILLLVFVSFSNSFAGQEGKGGDGYVASFIHTSHLVAEWLKANGQSLTPPVSYTAFESAVDANLISSTTKALFYKGVEKDCLFNEKLGTISINRLRWNTLPEDGPEMWRVTAHEIFRKMKIEGDEYEVTKQIIIGSFGKGPCSNYPVCNSVPRAMLNFTYNDSRSAFESSNSHSPTLDELVGLWQKIGEAANPDWTVRPYEVYDPTGIRNPDGSVPYIEFFSSEGDFYGNSSLGVKLQNINNLGNNLGPYRVDLNSDGACFGSFQNENSHYARECRIIDTKGKHLICAERLFVDDFSKTADIVKPFNGKIIVFRGYIKH